MNDYQVGYPTLIGVVKQQSIEYKGWSDDRKPRAWQITVEDDDAKLKSVIELPLMYAPPALGTQVTIQVHAATALGAPLQPALQAAAEDNEDGWRLSKEDKFNG